MSFPLNSKQPYVKDTGERSTLGAELSAGGGGGSYTLPTASSETKGGVKIGSGLTMTGEVLSNNNPTPYSLPTASAETLGGVKVGSGLTIADGVLSASGGGSVEYRAGTIEAFSASANNTIYKTVTFTNPMPDANYSVSVQLGRDSDASMNTSKLRPFYIKGKTKNGFGISGYNDDTESLTLLTLDWIAIANRS